MRIGVISDTHGLLRPEALETLADCERIIHAGDVGDREILKRLSAIGPVTAVRGNVDRGAWARELPENNVLEVERQLIFILHSLDQLDLKPEASGFRVVIYGHSHVPAQETRNGVLYFNPGSAGPKRFHLPVTVGRLVVEGSAVTGEILDLEQSGVRVRSKEKR